MSAIRQGNSSSECFANDESNIYSQRENSNQKIYPPPSQVGKEQFHAQVNWNKFFLLPSSEVEAETSSGKMLELGLAKNDHLLCFNAQIRGLIKTNI